ncbi:MAG: hypothetical protein WCI71_18910 [Bacteroidota bacterium]
MHVKDLFLHHPDQGPCNFHSWSKHGNWKPFCYPRDEDKKNSVWDKPREITRYPARAYEIVYWENNPLEADTILWVWKSESYFNDFLTNSGKWSGVKWGAIGIAVYENYACAWFGEATDPEGPVVVCGIPSKAPVSDSVKKVPKPHVSPKPIVKKIPDSLNKPKSAPSLKTGAMIPGSMDTISGKPSIKNDSLASQNITYFIIVKTNLPRTTAEKLLVNLKAEGYPDARILEKDNKIRISVFESAERTKVLGKLKEVKKTYKDAWLLKVIRN